MPYKTKRSLNKKPKKNNHAYSKLIRDFNHIKQKEFQEQEDKILSKINFFMYSYRFSSIKIYSYYGAIEFMSQKICIFLLRIVYLLN